MMQSIPSIPIKEEPELGPTSRISVAVLAKAHVAIGSRIMFNRRTPQKESNQQKRGSEMEKLT